MQHSLNTVRNLFMLTGLIGLIGCTKVDEYKKYIDDNRTGYPAKIDSLRVYSGHNRVVVRSASITDPTVRKVIVYWNNRRDSMVVELADPNGVRSLNRSLSLPEGLYYFDLFTFDEKGNRSVPVSSLGISYGSLYEQSLIPRTIRQIELVENGLVIRWNQPIHASRGVRLTYVDQHGDPDIRWVSNAEEATSLPTYMEGIDIGIQTWFLPDTLSVDTFFTPLQMVDPSLFLVGNAQN